jgi:chemotaxis protein methyltransferase CheR
MIFIGDQEFKLFQELIHAQAGILLSSAKKTLLEARLGTRVRDLGLDSFRAYYRYVVAGGNDELFEMLDRISTNETSFFREPQQFDFLSQVAVHDWATQAGAGFRPRRIRAWSAGCSSGEEAYSLAMVLWWHLAPAGSWQIDILATDISRRIIARARNGVWPIEKAREIPNEYLTRYMLKGTGKQAGYMKAGAEISSMLQFKRLNLNDELYPVPSPFDLILCRNVLIYFDPKRRARVIDRLLSHLRPGGLFFVGYSERLVGVTTKVVSIWPTIYVRIDEANSGANGAVQREACPRP